jgi:hypothetical protein
MNRRTLWIGAAALVLAAGCNRNDARTGSGAAPDQAKVTLVGCLQPGEQGLASREPNDASRSAQGVDQFVLANATPPASPSASPGDATGPLYILEGKTDELRQHVGRQVEIVGEPGDSSDPNSSNARRIEVDSVRMIASSCASR